MSVSTPPKARPAAALVAPVVAAALIALAVVAVRDLAVTQGWSTGTAWSLDLVESLDGLTATAGVVVIGIALVLLGLLVSWLALKPATRTHLKAATDSDLWLSRGAVAALAQAVADRSSGVVSADASRGGRRRINVDVVTLGDAPEVTRRIDAALAGGVADLTTATINVRTTEVAR